MAKSFYTIIEEKKLEVTHVGNSVELDLPDWLCDAQGKLESEEALVQWAEEHEIIHGLLHAGIQQIIIQLRAAARPGEDTNILADEENAQKRVDNFVVKAVKRPGTGTSKTVSKAVYTEQVKLARAMRETGLNTDMIKDVLGKNCDSVTVAKILNEIVED